MLNERHECNTSENFAFDNGTGKNIFSHPYIYYMANQRLQGEEQFYTENYLLEMSLFHAKIRIKSAPKKTKLFSKNYVKSYIRKVYTRL